MKTKTIKIYRFNELKKEIKEKVLKRFRENNDYYFLSEYLNEMLKEELKKYKIEDLGKTELRYSLGNCQGDGLSFIGLFRWKGYLINIEMGNLSNLYTHSKTTNIYINKDNSEIEAGADIYKKFESVYFKICDILEKEGYKFIENEDSNETIKENILLNDYYFRETGEIEKL